MKRAIVVAVAFCLASAFAVSSAHADEGDGEDDESPALHDHGGFDLHLGFGVVTPNFGTHEFSGEGTLLGTHTHKTFSATGRAIGLVLPRVDELSIGVGYLRRYVSIGATFGMAVYSRTDAPPQNPALAEQVSVGQLRVYDGAIDLAAVFPVERVSVRAGALIGVRYASVPLGIFEPATCGSGSKSSPCAARASTFAPYVQPRLGVDVALGEIKRDASWVPTLGAYVGYDVIDHGGVAFGVVLSMRTPQWLLAP